MFSTDEAARLSGCSYRQIDYWSRIGAISPHVEAHGSGSRRTWTTEHVERLGMIAALTCLLQRGVAHEVVAAIWNAKLGEDEATITLACDERGRLVRIRQAGLITRPLLVVPRVRIAELAARPEAWERTPALG